MVEKTMDNVKLETKANVYFDGKVTSRVAYREDGSRFTLGIITAGSYTFDVGDREGVQLIAGEAEVLLPGQADWQKIVAPDGFGVGPNCSFQIRTTGVVEYLCDYFKD